MIRTQIQIPDGLYASAKAVAERREISLAELIRRGLEYMIAVSVGDRPAADWALPVARRLGGADPFATPGWRADLHVSARHVAEAPSPYRAAQGSRRKPQK